ncbi:hypothetical protein MKX08_003458 [Trichoderma sp. CBMAI-0020]|nr:hypothetical protein MKX08_003458 [Trichoderma sp. CBMAI-0020]WOD46468.1 hypothetical protein [Trichoderma atroviride]
METARTGRLVVGWVTPANISSRSFEQSPKSLFSNEIEARLTLLSAKEATLVFGLDEVYSAGRNFSSSVKAALGSNVSVCALGWGVFWDIFTVPAPSVWPFSHGVSRWEDTRTLPKTAEAIWRAVSYHTVFTSASLVTGQQPKHAAGHPAAGSPGDEADDLLYDLEIADEDVLMDEFGNGTTADGVHCLTAQHRGDEVDDLLYTLENHKGTDYKTIGSNITITTP